MNVQTAKNQIKNPPKPSAALIILELAIIVPVVMVLHYIFA